MECDKENQLGRANSLIKGWEWLKANEDHPDHSKWLDHWWDDLAAYAEQFGMDPQNRSQTQWLHGASRKPRP